MLKRIFFFGDVETTPAGQDYLWLLNFILISLPVELEA